MGVISFVPVFGVFVIKITPGVMDGYVTLSVSSYVPHAFGLGIFPRGSVVQGML